MRFPWLFVLFALMLAIDLALPDIVPFLDEAILALGTALFAMWKERRLIADDQSHAGRSVAAQASPPR